MPCYKIHAYNRYGPPGDAMDAVERALDAGALEWHEARRMQRRIEAEKNATPVYTGGRKADLLSLMRAYRAAQVTAAEFSARMRWLMRAGVVDENNH